MTLPKNRRQRHRTTSPSTALQEYIPPVNIDLAREYKCTGCGDTIFMDLNVRVVLGYSAKHTICMKCFTEEQVAVKISIQERKQILVPTTPPPLPLQMLPNKTTSCNANLNLLLLLLLLLLPPRKQQPYHHSKHNHCHRHRHLFVFWNLLKQVIRGMTKWYSK